MQHLLHLVGHGLALLQHLLRTNLLLGYEEQVAEEQEVLFIPGTCFRIESIRDDMEGTTIKPYIIVLFVRGEEDLDSSWSKDVQEIDWV